MVLNEAREQEIRRIVEEILRRREFRQTNNRNPIADMVRQVWDSILEWIRELFAHKQPQRNIQYFLNPRMQSFLKIALIALASTLLFIIIGFTIKRFYLPVKRKSTVPRTSDYVENPELALEKMKTLISEKNYKQALRFLFINFLLLFHKNKIIHIEKWKTNRTYIREISVNAPEVSEQIRELSVIFNGCCYGNRTIDADCINRWFDFYKNLREKYESKD
jgi:hypothetical protein